MDDFLDQSSPAVAQPVVWWLRLEAGAVAVLSAVLYARTGPSWWWFAGLWLTPDLAMLAYLASPRIGAFSYNTVHSYLLPASLSVAGLLSHQSAVIPFALIWFNHIGVDRFLGYGLKYPAGFAYTHLQALAKPGKH